MNSVPPHHVRLGPQKVTLLKTGSLQMEFVVDLEVRPSRVMQRGPKSSDWSLETEVL